MSKGNKIYYFKSQKTEKHNIFELAKIDIINPSKEEIIKKFVIDRGDCQHNLLGVVFNKPFIRFTKKNSGIDEA